MSDIILTRGDSQTYRLTIVDDVGTAIDLTGAILKFAVKAREKDSNLAALIFKTSYDAKEIDIDDPLNGKALVFVCTEDTYDQKVKKYIWDVEVNRKGLATTSAGSFAVTAGSGLLVGTGLDLSLIKVGDIIEPVSANPQNTVPFTVTSVGGDGADDDPGAGNLLTDYVDFVAETGITFQSYTVNRKTPSGLSGAFALIADVVT